ncbi:hypothetical protein EDC19_1529 [Natranaerovirga hydrolytica]|uniref:Uncharacterized protein n=1 Tax=Natranaerovirga hydrolytica TaxID=680378 RepID=A0A4R1ML68_9FIRM|nr:DUF6608 family protein [Natranaerovirga hydrolytica]TCK93337.1 hypothetical protein EDC19_1529 [Natranaerovirga hydrolytica]
MKKKISKFKNSNTLKREFITPISVLFTTVTIIHSLMVVSGIDSPKQGVFAYIHLLTRFVLIFLIVSSTGLSKLLKKSAGNKVIVYVIPYIITLGLMLLFVFVKGFKVDLHPDAYIDISMSFTAMYIIYLLIKEKVLTQIISKLKKENP